MRNREMTGCGSSYVSVMVDFYPRILVGIGLITVSMLKRSTTLQRLRLFMLQFGRNYGCLWENTT